MSVESERFARCGNVRAAPFAFAYFHRLSRLGHEQTTACAAIAVGHRIAVRGVDRVRAEHVLVAERPRRRCGGQARSRRDDRDPARAVGHVGHRGHRRRRPLHRAGSARRRTVRRQGIGQQRRQCRAGRRVPEARRGNDAEPHRHRRQRDRARRRHRHRGRTGRDVPGRQQGSFVERLAARAQGDPESEPLDPGHRAHRSAHHADQRRPRRNLRARPEQPLQQHHDRRACRPTTRSASKRTACRR